MADAAPLFTVRVAVDAPQHSGLNGPLDYASEQALASGTLVRLFDVAQLCEEAHYLVHLPEGLEKPGVAAFRKWIVEEMRQFQAQSEWPGTVQKTSTRKK